MAAELREKVLQIWLVRHAGLRGVVSIDADALRAKIPSRVRNPHR